MGWSKAQILLRRYPTQDLFSNTDHSKLHDLTDIYYLPVCTNQAEKPGDSAAEGTAAAGSTDEQPSKRLKVQDE